MSRAKRNTKASVAFDQLFKVNRVVAASAHLLSLAFKATAVLKAIVDDQV